MIKQKTIESRSKKIWTVELDGHEEECHSASHAKERLIELKTKRQERLDDFLITEKLFGWVWVNSLGVNYLAYPEKAKTSIYTNLGKNDKFETSGILWYSNNDTHFNPPEFNRPENFLSLISNLIKNSCVVLFDKPGGDCFAQVITPNDDEINHWQKKEKDYWSDEYCYTLALKKVAVEYCKNL